jgi:hypothetical protein
LLVVEDLLVEIVLFFKSLVLAVEVAVESDILKIIL